MDKKRALSLLDKFPDGNILVIGDLMLDEYIEGSIERISPEAPIPVVNVFNQNADRRLGGAANVFNNLVSLGGKNISLCGIVGDDENGDILRGKLKFSHGDIDGIIVELNRPTTIKTRIIAHNQQVIRLDREERAPISKESRHKVIEYVKEKIETVKAIIISDYEKGLITEQLLREIIPRAVKKGICVAVDPKFSNFKHFKKATIVVPNVKEAQAFARHEVETLDDVLDAAQNIFKALDCEYVLIKMGERGMALVSKKGQHITIQTAAIEVYDVTGAGDTVISTLVLARTAGASWEEAARLANAAAGIAVSHRGTSTVALGELKKAIRNNRFPNL
jgi:D-beta-D-heptose 7-phosphate kinase/D-beta-D-heptose 1-phosphate adenosyltransferase